MSIDRATQGAKGEGNFDYDYLIVGSGFGGSASAYRLVDSGWKVALVEQGKRIDKDLINAGKKSMFKLVWMPALRMYGYFTQILLKHVFLAAGIGFGGGSIVWASVMLEPKQKFYDALKKRGLGGDWKESLSPHFRNARRMLGISTNPHKSIQDSWLEETAKSMGTTTEPISNAILFEENTQGMDDPYFEGKGPVRNACQLCGGCVSGCPHNAKNSLDKNYLYLAEQAGLEVMTETTADKVSPLPNGGYEVELLCPYTSKLISRVRTRKLVLSGGVMGTLKLLFRNRDDHQTLAGISAQLGHFVRTNSEAFTAVLHDKTDDLLDGTAISSHFFPSPDTHITNNRIDEGLKFIRFQFVPLTGNANAILRPLKTLWNILTHPRLMLNNWFCSDWEKRFSLMTTMQDKDSYLTVIYRRTLLSPFRKTLQTEKVQGSELPSFIAEANQAAQALAKASGGQPMSFITECFLGVSNTAHILGGCSMGFSSEDGVIDTGHQVFGYPGLYVCDGSSIPENLGVNPSLTITAMAERFAAQQGSPS